MVAAHLGVVQTWFLLAVVSVTLLGAAVRVGFLDGPMRYDEAWNYLHFSSRSPGYIITHYVPNNQMLHTLLVRGLSRWTGTSPAALRIPAFTAGVALIPLTAWLAWVLCRNRGTALLAAVAVAASGSLIEYSVNTRGYSWLAVLATLLVICTAVLLRGGARRGLWLVWGGLGALGAFCHPAMAYAVVGASLATVATALRAGRRTDGGRELLRGLALGIAVCGPLTVLLYAPAVLVTGWSRLTEVRGMADTIFAAQVGSPLNMLWATWMEWTWLCHPVWATLLAVGLVAFVASAVRRRTPHDLLGISLLGIGPLLAVLQGMLLPPRTWIYALPVFYVGAAEGLRRISEPAANRRGYHLLRWSVATLTVLAVGLSLDQVRRQPTICSDPESLMDIEQVVDAYVAEDVTQSALVMRYTPALAYYKVRKQLPDFAEVDAPQVDRVFIVADTRHPLEQVWHAGVPGFASFGPPRVWRTFSGSVMYVAERMAHGSPDPT